jgi:simple sugar transport system ATP-binding protein
VEVKKLGADNGQAGTVVVELRSVSKHYSGVTAVEDVSLSLFAGQVVCLLGENGAGKSTLIRVLTGVEAPSSGEVLVEGHATHFSSARAARQLGISTVYQEVGTLPLMTVGRNFVLGQEPIRNRWLARRIDFRRANLVAVQKMQELGIRRIVDGNQLVGTLSGGERQALAITRAVHYGARVLVLDEPTAALGVRESSLVLRLIQRVREHHVAVLFITHNAYHAVAVGDRFVVMRRGQLIADFPKGDGTLETITRLMSGGDELSELIGLTAEPEG